jgi:CHAT domain-containing protein
MRQRLSRSLIAILLLLAAHAAEAQEAAKADPETVAAFELFHQGKVRQAAKKYRAVIERIPEPIGRVPAQRALLELCATAYDWNCVAETLSKVVPHFRSEPKLKILFPDLLLYEARLMLWKGDDEYFAQLVKNGAASAATPATRTSLHSELALTLHRYHLKRLEASAAEQLRSSAILGLLLTDPKETYAIAKVLIDLMEAMLQAQDIAGAYALASDAETYLTSSLNHGSALFARYRLLVADLLSFTNAHAATVSNFMEAFRLFEQLDIDDDVKEYRIAVANNLAVAALVLDNKVDQAVALHAQSPLQKRKNAILEGGEFQSNMDFYFGVADIFLSVAASKPPEPRWRKLFEKEPTWRRTEFEKTDTESYRNFALGLIDLSAKALEDAQKLVLLAARQRIENFERVLALNFEGFPVPSLVDRIVISAGLAAAVKVGDKDSLDLMVRGSEVLGRNLRHQLVDTAALLAAQPDIASRREAHAYLHLLARKREWEQDRIRKLMIADPSLENRGAIIDNYTKAVTTIANLKEKLQTRATMLPAVTASLARIQQSLAHGQAYVGYFPYLGGVGKFCVTRADTFHATTELNPEILSDARALTASLTVFPKDAAEAAQFPAASAVRLYKFLFAGLERCLVPGTHAIVALPFEFAGVPLGALLREEPPSLGNGFDLREANWLIKDLSFSIVISARHHLATSQSVAHPLARRPFLGIGDPYLVGDHAAKLASTELLKSTVKTKRGALDIAPLPETADELKGAAKLFGASDADILLGLHGTEERFRARPLSDYDVLHFATHGLVKDDFAGLTESALVLTPGDPGDKFDDGLLTAPEIARLSLNARLVILSACNTAKYDVAQASRSVQDLQAAFAVAGAPTLLASLWPVDSLATKDLIARFLTEWRAPGTKGAADALARAMRHFLERSDTLQQHPSFWAPFVIIGHGGVAGAAATERGAPPLTFEFLPGFSSHGEIFDAVRAGPDLIFSLIGEWDGAKMNGILTRRSIHGAEKWKTGTREIGAGRIAISGDTLYTAGYSTAEGFIPVVRSFTTSGRLRWKMEFPEIPEHTLGDVVATPSGAFVATAPTIAPKDADTAHDVWVLSLGKDGKLLTKSRMHHKLRAGNFGHPVLMARWNERLVVVANSGRPIQPRHDKKTLSGLPTICWEGSSTTIYVLDPQNLRLTSSTSIPDFATNALTTLNDALFLGGEVQNNCLHGGVASVVRMDRSGKTRSIWKDDDLFTTAVRGMAAAQGRLALAIGHERTLGLPPDKQRNPAVDVDKRWSDELATAREASLVRLTADGVVLDRQYLVGGLGMFVQGLLPTANQLIAYGAMGGLPAYTPPPGTPTSGKHKLQPRKSNPGGWETKVLVGR